LLPEQKVEVEVDPASIDAARNSPSSDQFLLQAGSFQLAEDADRRRGELVLLGLDSHVQKTSVDNGRWYRVYIGPFESRSKLAKARSVTAQQGIDTLLLKRPLGGL
jgi:cell division protein FtsN